MANFPLNYQKVKSVTFSLIFKTFYLLILDPMRRRPPTRLVVLDPQKNSCGATEHEIIGSSTRNSIHGFELRTFDRPWAHFCYD